MYKKDSYIVYALNLKVEIASERDNVWYNDVLSMHSI